jgi:hypothetical protein
MENHFSRLIEKSELYIKQTGELYKLKAIEKSAEVIASFTSNLIIIIAVTIFVITFNIGIAIWLGEYLGKMHLGFLYVSGFYILVSLLIHLLRKNLIEHPVKDAFIQKFFTQNENPKD